MSTLKVNCITSFSGNSINMNMGTGSLGLPVYANTGSAGNLWFDPATSTIKFSYLGSVWSEGGALITARRGLGGAGIQNEALAFGGGNPAAVACTEEYNGTSWSAGGALGTARYFLAGAGTQNAGLAFGGTSPTRACTEEYNGPDVFIKTVTAT